MSDDDRRGSSPTSALRRFRSDSSLSPRETVDPALLEAVRGIKQEVDDLHDDQGHFEESSSLAFAVLTKQVKSLKEAYSVLADSFVDELERVHAVVHALDAREGEARDELARVREEVRSCRQELAGREELARAIAHAEQHANEQFELCERATKQSEARLAQLESLTHKVADEIPDLEKRLRREEDDAQVCKAELKELHTQRTQDVTELQARLDKQESLRDVIRGLWSHVQLLETRVQDSHARSQAQLLDHALQRATSIAPRTSPLRRDTRTTTVEFLDDGDDRRSTVAGAMRESRYFASEAEAPSRRRDTRMTSMTRQSEVWDPYAEDAPVPAAPRGTLVSPLREPGDRPDKQHPWRDSRGTLANFSDVFDSGR